MRINILSILLLVACFVFSCKKDKCEKKFCKMDECVVCDDKRFDNKDKVKPDHYIDKDGNKISCNVEKYILSPIVKDSDCGYIVSGKIKYVVNGKTAGIVDYGDGEKDAWAVKTMYFRKHDKGHHKGNKHWNKHEYTKCCKFKQICKPDAATESVAKESFF